MYYFDIIYTICVPEGPKLLTNPSANPTVYNALLTMFAKKNNVPIDPPNSGPNVRLIMTELDPLRKIIQKEPISFIPLL